MLISREQRAEFLCKAHRRGSPPKSLPEITIQEELEQRIEAIKKEQEEKADKDRRSKIPSGFDIWED